MYILNVLIQGFRGKAIHYEVDSGGVPLLYCGVTVRSSLWTPVPTGTVSLCPRNLSG
jgi:hypothetical protein